MARSGMQRHRLFLLAAVWTIANAFPGSGPRLAGAAETPPAAVIDDAAATGLLRQHCVRCHTATKSEANLRLDQGPQAFPEETWEKVVDALQHAAMPPEDEPQPSAEVRDRLAAWARARLDRLVLARAGDPGSVAGRRLTILEMENMVRDLTGSEIQVRDLLGQDTVGGEGFTNIGSAQSSMTASLLDKYLSAADRVVEHARFDELGRLVFDPPGQVASAQVREDASIIDLMVLNGRAVGSVFLGKGKSTTAPGADDERGVHGLNMNAENRWQGFGRYLTAIWLATAAADPPAVLPQLAERMELNPVFLGKVWERWQTCPPDSLEHRLWVASIRSLPKPGAWTAEPPEAVRRTLDVVGESFWRNRQDQAPLPVTKNPLVTLVPPHLVASPPAVRPPLLEAPLLVAVHDAFLPHTAGGHRVGWPQIRITETVTEKVDGKEKRATNVSYRPLSAGAVEVFMPPAGQSGGTPAAIPSPAWERHSFTGLGSDPLALPAVTFSGPVYLRIGLADLAHLDVLDTGGKPRTGVTVDVVLPVAAATDDLVLRAGVFRKQRDMVLDIDGFAEIMRLTLAKAHPIEISWLAVSPAAAATFQKELPPQGFADMAERWPSLAPRQMAPFAKYRWATMPNEMKYLRDDARLGEWAMGDAERTRADTLWRYNEMLCGEHVLRLQRFEERFGVTAADRDDPAAVRKILDALRPAKGGPYPGEPPPGIGVAPYDLFERWQYYRRAVAEAAGFWRERTLAAVEDFATRAWRRPLTTADREALAAAYDSTGQLALMDAEGVLRALLARVLVSPHFLYRMEQGQGEGSATTALPPWELATRLSLTLWASLPDEELRRHAADGSLLKDDVLRSQVRRMLADPRAGGTGLVEHFFGEWLGFVGFGTSTRGPDATVFPEFTPQVRRSLHGEATAFFTDLVRNDRDVRMMLDGGHSFLDEPLRTYYRPDGEPAFRFAEKVSADSGLPPALAAASAPLAGFSVTDMRAAGRGGVLGLGAILVNNSRQKRTSPTNRGAWVVEKLLGRHIPPPPPNVQPLPDEPASAANLSLHEQLQRHSRDAACAGCHRRIDPYGYALESFEASGRRRSREHLASLVSLEDRDGRRIDGLDGLRSYLRDHETETLRSLVRHFVGYALNRGVLLTDRPLIDDIVAALPQNEYRFSTVVERVVLSQQFRFRR